MEDYQTQFVFSLLAYCAQRDVSPERLCQLAGIDFERFKQQREAITHRQFDDLWAFASQLSKDSLFGLHVGESMQLAALGVVGQIIQTSRTVGEALTHAAGLIHLVTDLFRMEVNRSHEHFTVYFLPDQERANKYPSTFRHMMDLCFILVMHEVDGLVLEKLKPSAIELTYEKADETEYERVLRCKPTHATDVYSLEFDARYWDEPILTANYELQSILLQKASALSSTLASNQPLNERIGSYLLANAYLGIPTLDGLAANFNTSARSLQRKLQDEGVTYQQLADSIRKSLAVHYLESGKYPMKEISYLLGYNELSAFTRAFKRWTGLTPGSFQRS